MFLALLMLSAGEVWASHSVHSAWRPGSSGTSGNFGLGLMFGEPTGVTAKYWLSSSSALDAGLTYSFGDWLDVIFDYTWAFPHAFRGAPQLVPYVGIGGVFMTGSSRYYYNGYERSRQLGIALRIPLGLELVPQSAPIGVFAELAPGVAMFPGVFAMIQGDIGIRFYF